LLKSKTFIAAANLDKGFILHTCKAGKPASPLAMLLDVYTT
jgi:hypothetical protein